jgi:hypothetical protein
MIHTNATNDLRRNPLDALRSNASDPQAPLAYIPVASLRDEKKEEALAKRRAKRRAYDKKNPLAFYYVPTDLQEKMETVLAHMQKVADQYSSTQTLVAIGFANYTLEEIRSGRHRLEPRPNPKRRKMGISLIAVNTSKIEWPKQEEDAAAPHRLKRKDKRVNVIGWRFPGDMRAEIKTLANQTMTIGEVVVLLLDYASKMLKAGLVEVNPQTIDMRQGISLTNARDSKGISLADIRNGIQSAQDNSKWPR